MTNVPPTREDAWTLLTSYNQSESLRKHALAVEGVMRHFARKYGEDETMWGIIGLIHDLRISTALRLRRFCVKTTGRKSISARSSVTATASVRMSNRARPWSRFSLPWTN